MGRCERSSKSRWRWQGPTLKPGLVDAILSDVGDEPGNLPLLEHALLQLWERRQGNTITHKAYNDIGRLSGALKNHADRVYDEAEGSTAAGYCAPDLSGADPVG